jgi:glycosyltransferase involved in cell wall biosynthesis
MFNEKSVSLVIPAKNELASLPTVLDSIPSYVDEVIIVDGHSSDGTLEIINKYKNRIAKIVSEKDDGQYHAIKKGFALATGELFCWLNSDDIYFPWTFRIVNRIFSEFNSIQWISGLRADMRDEALLGMNDAIPFPRELIQSGWFHPGSACGCIMQEASFWTKKLYDLSGGIDCMWKMAADFDLWIRFSQHANLYANTAILGAFNYTGKNRSHQEGGSLYSKEVEMIKSSIPEKQRKIGDWLNKKKNFAQKLFFKHPWLAIFLGEYMRKTGLSGPFLGFSPSSNQYILHDREFYM